MDFSPKIDKKRWDKELEPEIFEKWQKDGIFKFNQKERKPVYSIDTPPPYVNTPIHIGHAYTYVIMDIIARFKRMTGHKVLFPLGLDKNGLPIEVQAEKQFDISLHETPRKEFIKKCHELIDESGEESVKSFQQLGISFNEWEKKHDLGGRYDTDDDEYRRLTQETFIRLWEKGLIYEDVKPTNYCTDCGTTISNAEVEYREEDTNLNYIQFYVREKADKMGEYIYIATTRPELLCACKLILYNPDDSRYNHLEGRTATVPIYNHNVPIIAHPYAKEDFGSGLVMVCSFGDYSDVRILRKMDINPTYAINKDGRMTSAAGKYRGLRVKDARKAIIRDLKAEDFITKQESITHRQPICWRSKTPIEFVPMREFYLKQVEFKDAILEIADNINFYSPESKQILVDWINSINIDWVISRRRYYGTEVPLWYCKKCKETIVPPPGEYYQPWKDSSPIKECPKCGGHRFIGETRTFDTWFDSSSSVYYILGYLWDDRYWRRNMPCTLRPQGKEIVRTWLYFTLLKSYLLDEMQAFENCWIHMHVVDENGEKMSKSVGNVIDPQKVLKKYGADAFRIWTCLEGDISKGDVRCSFERIEGTAKFLTKFWNISRFISMFEQPTLRNANLTKTDKWILAELDKLEERVKEHYDSYEFNEAAMEIRDFTWNIFAANYIEMVKPRAYMDAVEDDKISKGAWYTLHECLKTLSLLLSPMIPFLTDHIWSTLYSDEESVHIQDWPDVEKGDKKLLELTEDLLEFNSNVWNAKKDKGLSLRDPIDMKVPKKLKPFEKDLELMHKLGTGPEKEEKEKKPKEKESNKKSKRKKKPKKKSEKPKKKSKKTSKRKKRRVKIPVTEIKGIGEKTAEKLEESRVKTAKGLLTLNPETLADKIDVSVDTAKKYQKRAKKKRKTAKKKKKVKGKKKEKNGPKPKRIEV